MPELTPLKKQYNAIKEKHNDCLLFFRLGDFYEMFDGDARIASRELDIALTTRDRNVPEESERTPMCGVPYHSAEAYISRLITKGYKIAICEQTEDPAAAKGLINREVVRVITPGTVTDESMLPEGKSNYICSVFLELNAGAVAFCDVSTGEFCAAGFTGDAGLHIVNELSRFAPSEAVLSLAAAEDEYVTGFLKKSLNALCETKADDFDFTRSAARICDKFAVSDTDALGLGGSPTAVCAAGALLKYLSDTQKCSMEHINQLDVFTAGRFMELDHATRRGLELCENMRTGEKKGSLLWALDKTKTPMGGRLLRSWVERPLLSPIGIKRRLAAVNELFCDHVLRAELIRVLRGVGDMRRIVSRAVYGTANAKDLSALGANLRAIPELRALLPAVKSQMLREISAADPLSDISGLIFETICGEPPFSVREGGIIRAGHNAEVDRLRKISVSGTELIRDMEQSERIRTGVKKLKIGYNRVFGYYIDIPRSSMDISLPEEYVRKQTLSTSERYFTQELKALEDEILSASDSLKELEYKLFCGVMETVALAARRIQQTADLVAALDALCSLADTAASAGYVMPEVDLSGEIRIIDGRHPVVEATRPDELFVPNDTIIDKGESRALIITGPNMAGKSTYLRQTALIALMAQIGSFVPARSATLGITDRVFTRIGASDDLAAGQSTFMVEMTEMANILRHATKDSLLILDEVGRGTSTFDGMAVARAILEHCADKKRLGAKTMFATHYHELAELEGIFPGIKNYSITAKKQDGELKFLRKIVPGAADDSFGIEVAKLAGVPDGVIKKADEYLKELENGSHLSAKKNSRDTARHSPESAKPSAKSEDPAQVSIPSLGGERALSRLRAIDPNTLAPLEALRIIFELKAEV